MQAQYYTSLIFPFLLLLDVFLVGKLDFKRALGNCALFELTLFILKFFFVRRESYFFFLKGMRMKMDARGMKGRVTTRMEKWLLGAFYTRT